MKRAFKAKKAVHGLIMLMGIMAFMLSYNTVYAIEDGAYIVNRTTSYNNPDTGLTARGETSNATGDGMSARILADEVLVEQSNGRTFVTIGMGMESSINSVTMQIQEQPGGPFLIVPHTITGTSVLNDDTCVHYRFEVTSPELIIAPRFIVEGMGMELEFYVTLHMNSLRPGTSIFLSEMVEAPVVVEEVVEPAIEDGEAGLAELEETEIEPVIEEPEAAEPTEHQLAMEDRLERLTTFMDPEANPLVGTSGLSTHVFMRSQAVEEEATALANIWIYLVGGVVGIGVLVGGYLVYRKKRGGGS